MSRATSRKLTKRRDGDPVKVMRDARVAYWDGGRPGVGERRFLRFNGDLDAAHAAAEELRSDLARLRASGPRGTTELYVLMAEMVGHLRGVNAPEGSVRQYRSNWNVWVPESVRTKRCNELTLTEWSVIFDHLNHKEAGPGTVKAVARTLGTLINYGTDRGYFDAGPPFGPPERRRRRVAEALKVAEAQRGLRASHPDAASTTSRPKRRRSSAIELQHCPTWPDVEKYALAFESLYPGFGYRLVLVAYSTGLRECELLGLRVEDQRLTAVASEIAVDRQLDRYRPWPATRLPKNDKRRVTIIWESFVDVLRDLAREATFRDDETRGWLFPPPPGRRYWADEVTHMATAAAQASGWAWEFHWLRHAFASLSMAPASAGGYEQDPAAVCEWLGHSSLALTLDTYRNPQPNAAAIARSQTAHHPRLSTTTPRVCDGPA